MYITVGPGSDEPEEDPNVLSLFMVTLTLFAAWYMVTVTSKWRPPATVMYLMGIAYPLVATASMIGFTADDWDMPAPVIASLISWIIAFIIVFYLL